jgi:imidazolonepropionase-like amidohydrolase
MKRAILALTLACVTTALIGRVSAQTPAVTVYEGARVIVGDGRAPIDNAVFVVTGNRITQVGTAATVKAPADAQHVNLAGKTVMPAIIDTHTHLSTNRDMLADDLARRAYYGIAATMSLGTDEGDLPYQMRGTTTTGLARFFTAGRGITSPEPGRTTVPYWITTPAEARKAVQELAAKHVDIVKIWVDDRNGMYKKLSPELYTAVIKEAHAHGLRVIAHIFALDDAKGLLKAGVDGFAHGVRDKDVDDEFMALLKRHKNLVLGPNMPDRGVVADIAWLRDSLSPADYQRLQAANTNRADAQAAWAIQARNLAKMSAAGVTIVVGTDGNTPYAPHQEMADMAAAGMTPAQVLVAATRNGARFLRMTDSGTIEAGKVADFLVLDANPLDDIANTRRIASVYLRGVVVNRTAYWVPGTAR